VTEDPIRVVIADDHALFRDTTRALLAPVTDIEVVAEAGSADETLAAVATHLPDVILMDLRMPGGGIDATRRVVQAAPHVAVLVLSMYEDERLLAAALAAGARGYVLKGARRSELVSAIRGVHRGEGMFGPALARRMTDLAAHGFAPAPPFPNLTDREREVLTFMARGLDNATIAARLFLSAKTVRNLASSILGKLEVHTRAEAVAMARDAGLGAPPSA
jgi:DNA-binding NarL/FixJ family response regulator